MLGHLPSTVASGWTGAEMEGGLRLGLVGGWAVGVVGKVEEAGTTALG